ncbi:Larval cuticle protein LCP-17 [Orchesella cincta]|uniref:Larval cuticle protein LCP-17 n=1 Tax=Orchesella cincta TaxID=48709 RepID=A0A1D2N6G1_ORCCI|nr:Larval cuticle protein LCP-17 [Orchesella cincta]
MKLLIVLAVCVAVSTAAPGSLKSERIPIVKFLLDDNNAGTYSLNTVSGDGSITNVEGRSKDLGDLEGPVTVKRGSYSFIGDDGKTYKVEWVADENGFQATGDHLPTPPPIPADIQKSLQENARLSPTAAPMKMTKISSPSKTIMRSQKLDQFAPVSIRITSQG